MGRTIAVDAKSFANFWKWFGDSKIRDEKGRPIVCYHGTAENVEKFNSFCNWFSLTPNHAGEYAMLRDYDRGHGANVTPAYIRAIHPFEGDKLARTNTIGSFVTELARQAKANGVHYDNNLIKGYLDELRACARTEESGPSYSEKDFWYCPTMHFGRRGEEILSTLYRTLGFDSIHYTEDGVSTIGVFDSNQVKSAVGNNGEFGETGSIVSNSVKTSICFEE